MSSTQLLFLFGVCVVVFIIYAAKLARVYRFGKEIHYDLYLCNRMSWRQYKRYVNRLWWWVVLSGVSSAVTAALYIKEFWR